MPIKRRRKIPVERLVARLYWRFGRLLNHPDIHLWKTPPRKVLLKAAKHIDDLCYLRRRRRDFRRATLWLWDQEDQGWPDGRDEELMQIDAGFEDGLEIVDQFYRVKPREPFWPPKRGVVGEMHGLTRVQVIATMLRDRPFTPTIEPLRELCHSVWVVLRHKQPSAEDEDWRNWKRLQRAEKYKARGEQPPHPTQT
jgi:hypothetical protein